MKNISNVLSACWILVVALGAILAAFALGVLPLNVNDLAGNPSSVALTEQQLARRESADRSNDIHQPKVSSRSIEAIRPAFSAGEEAASNDASARVMQEGKEAEHKVWNFFANAGLPLMSINSVHCDARMCEVELIGLDALSPTVDEFNELQVKMFQSGLRGKTVSVQKRTNADGTTSTLVTLASGA